MRFQRILILAIVMMGVIVSSQIHSHSKQQIEQKIGKNKIMYGATIRLKNIASGYQYILTYNQAYIHIMSTIHEAVDNNQQLASQVITITTHYGPLNKPMIKMLKPTVTQYINKDHELLCGDTIRLEHALTKRNLHSQEIYQSMISSEQQISAYGQSGEGDDNDNWILRCVNKNQGDQFYGGDIFELLHQNTEKRVKASRYYEYSFNTWENCPFQGQIQISGVPNHTKQTEWRIVGGVFFKDSNKNTSNSKNTEDEDL